MKKAHVLVVPFPGEGHITPILQFSKHLVSRGLKVTFVVTKFISNTKKLGTHFGPIQLDIISDGFDEGGKSQAKSMEAYLEGLHSAGPKTLIELIKKYQSSPNPIDCVVYEGFLAWALDVAKQFGLLGATFFTHMCAVDYIFYLVQRKFLPMPVTSVPVSVEGLPLLELQDLPSFVTMPESYPANVKMTLSQFANLDKADFVLVNTFYKLEPEPVESMSKYCPILTIGPTIPTFYLDKRLENDDDYGIHMFDTDESVSINWLSTKPPSSVVYVAFGSIANHKNRHQIQEIAWALKSTKFYFLWVVKASEEQHLPEGFIVEDQKGLIVNWSPQMKVLSNEAVGCFLTHNGWNSTIEALSLGVPMVSMPGWSDQQTNAKFVENVWKVGFRAKVDEEGGIVRREEIEFCIKEVMEGGRGRKMKTNCKKWKELAAEAVSEGGTSDKNIDYFVSKLTSSV